MAQTYRSHEAPNARLNSEEAERHNRIVRGLMGALSAVHGRASAMLLPTDSSGRGEVRFNEAMLKDFEKAHDSALIAVDSLKNSVRTLLDEKSLFDELDLLEDDGEEFDLERTGSPELTHETDLSPEHRLPLIEREVAVS